MNFFAHAAVACRTRDEPRFVLGSMLPDLASMIATRLRPVAHPEVAAGVALHHATDQRFHACAPFRALCESALVELEAAGVSRGGARAVGHVGSELLLDGVLSHERIPREAYARALDAGLEPGLLARSGFESDVDMTRLQELLQWLADGPLPEGYRDVDFVSERLRRILARRPRLALRACDVAPVRAWLSRAAPIVQEHAAALLEARASA